MKDHVNFRVIVCLFVLITYFILLLLKDKYDFTVEWVSIGTVMIVIVFFFIVTVSFSYRYSRLKTRSLVTDMGAAILNPVFGMLISRWIYISFKDHIYIFPIAISALMFFIMPLLGNWLYSGHGRYRSVYYYALSQVIFVGVGIWLITYYYEYIKSLLF